jgi:uncharacterized protein (TIGR03546 family)
VSLILKQVFSFFKLLNSDQGTGQIAAGMVCGMILGLSPVLSIQAILVFVAIFLFRVQAGAAFTTAALFKVIGFALAPLFDGVGGWALQLDALRPLYTEVYQAPLIPLTRFNHSVVMGSGIVAVALAAPFYFLCLHLVATYRTQVVARYKASGFWKLWSGTGFYQWYCKYEALHG